MEQPAILETKSSVLRSSDSLQTVDSEHVYRAGGGVSMWRMFWTGVAILYRDFPLLLWRAWVDTKARYRRSILGPYWLTIGTLTFVAGYSILAGLLFKRPLEEFLGYIAAGVITWQFISTNIAEGSKVFVGDATEIRSVQTNLLNLPVKLLLRALIGFLHSVPVVILVVVFTDTVNLNTLLFIPGLALLSLSILPLATALGTIAARYRDVEQLIAMLMQFMFYMTPLLWKAELLGDGYGRWIALGNPFYHMITMVRNPLLGLPVPGEVWIGAIGFLLLSNLIGFTLFARYRQRIPFWI